MTETPAMEVPLIFDHEFRRRSSMDSDYRGDTIYDIVCVNDDKEHFLDFLNTYDTEIDQASLWSSLFMYDAVKCVTAVLDGETKGLLDHPPHILYDGRGYGLLELAIDFGAYRLTKLILDRQGSHVANIRDVNNKLPLNYTLEPLFRNDQKPTKSILYRLVEIRDTDHGIYLETSRILAHHTRDV